MAIDMDDTIRIQHGVLVAIEWAGAENDSTYAGETHPGCPSCGGTKPGSGDAEYEGHADGCGLRAAIDAGNEYLGTDD